MGQWRKFIHAKVNDKELVHFKRDVRSALVDLAQIQDMPLAKTLGKSIVDKAKDYSPDEWKPGSGELKSNIRWRRYKLGGKGKSAGEFRLSVTSSAKRGDVPYAKIQEEGLPKFRSAKDKEFMRFPHIDGGGLHKISSTISFIQPSRYMERAIQDVLRASGGMIQQSFDRWNKNRLKHFKQVKKGGAVKPRKVSGVPDSEIKAPVVSRPVGKVEDEGAKKEFSYDDLFKEENVQKFFTERKGKLEGKTGPKQRKSAYDY